MLNVYLIRHGQSEANIGGYFCGNTDVMLTDQGREDARKAGKLLQGIDFAKVYVSNLTRAQDTMRLALPGMPYTVDSRLEEGSVGNLAGHYRDEMIEKYGDSLTKAFQSRCFSPYGGEDFPHHVARVKSFRDQLEKENIDGNVAVFAHDGTIRAFLQLLTGPAMEVSQSLLYNGSVSIFSYDGNQWMMKQWNLI